MVIPELEDASMSGSRFYTLFYFPRPPRPIGLEPSQRQAKIGTLAPEMGLVRSKQQSERHLKGAPCVQPWMELMGSAMLCPAGKLDLYCAAAGFHPARVLPCVIDVGTDNEALRNDPMYMGLQHPRLQGDAYFEV